MGLASNRNTALRSNRTLIVVVALAAVLRLILLDVKPAHFDEGVNGWFVDQITRTGFYHYDPTNYHGPLHFYVLFLFQTLFGRHAWALRLPVVLVSTLTVWLITRFEQFLPGRTSILAALAMAISPAAVFYGRYAIHESWLVLFLLLTVWALMGLWSKGERKYLCALGAGVTGMILTKETYFIHVACLLLAGICLGIFERLCPSSPPPRARQLWSSRDAAVILLASLATLVFFYSGTFFDFGSLKGLYQTYTAWFHTGAAGNGHEKPFGYWFTLFIRYEWIALLGLVGSVRYLWPGSNRFMRYLALYGIGAFLAYSIIHYKTPWCVASIIWPFFFVFGNLADEFCSKFRSRIAIGSVACLCVATVAATIRLNFYRYTDESEPYVYVQTLKDVNKLLRPLGQMVARDPGNYHMTGHIMLPSYHPLPWLLGDFTSIGYYSEDQTPDKMDADFLLVDKSRIEEVQLGLKQDYFIESLKLRASMDQGKLYLNANKFRELFPGRRPEFSPEI